MHTEVFRLTPASTPNSVNNTALDFGAYSIVIDNPTGQWWQIGLIGPSGAAPQVPVPPYVVRMTISLGIPTTQVNLQPITPIGLVSAPLPNQVASFTYTDQQLPPSPGYNAAPPSMSLLATQSVADNGSFNVSLGPVPSGTTLLILETDSEALTYRATITDPSNLNTLYVEDYRPWASMRALPLMPSTNGTYTLNIQMFSAYQTTVTFRIYAAAGNLPTIVQPMEGFIRTAGEVVNIGYADYDASTPNGDAGTYRWNVQNPSQSDVLFVMDYGFIQIGFVTSPTNLAVALTLDTLGGVEEAVVAQILNQSNTGIPIPGPVYISPGNQLRGFTQNQSGATVNLVVSAVWHTEPL